MQEDNRDTDCVPLTSGRRPGAHSFEEGFSEAANEVFAELECSAAAQFSQVTSRSRNSHRKTTHIVVMQRYVRFYHSPNCQQNAQNRLQFCLHSEPGSKEYGWGGMNASASKPKSNDHIPSILGDFTSRLMPKQIALLANELQHVVSQVVRLGPVLLCLCCTCQR